MKRGDLLVILSSERISYVRGEEDRTHSARLALVEGTTLIGAIRAPSKYRLFDVSSARYSADGIPSARLLESAYPCIRTHRGVKRCEIDYRTRPADSSWSVDRIIRGLFDRAISLGASDWRADRFEGTSADEVLTGVREFLAAL